VSLVIILIVKALILGFMINWVFGGDFEAFLYEMRAKPIKLALLFLAAYVFGAIFMFPKSVLMIAMAYSFTHIYGVLNGLLLVVVWNYICATIAYSLVFLVARYLIGDFVYSRCIENRYFFKFDRAV
jgi:uncharacterized membrane protein YdjX (TVP38/TMEM64 family)